MNRRTLLLVSVLLSTLAMPLTITGASVALPDIRDQLGAGLVPTQWVVNGYNTAFAGCLTFAGSLADILGRRRMFRIGAAGFMIAGLLCAVADDILLLNIARVVAGVGAAVATAAATSSLAAGLDGPARSRAFGLLGTTLGVGLAAGPTIAGYLVELANWRVVFVAPVLLVGCALLLTPWTPALTGDRARPIDRLGGALFTGTLIALIVTIVDLPSLGPTDPLTISGAVLTLVLGVGFVLSQRRVPHPMVPATLLARRGFAGYAVAAGTFMAMLVPFLVYLPSYLITVVKVDSGQAGLWLLALTVPSVLLPGLGARLARRRPVFLVVGAMLLGASGSALLSISDGDSGFPAFLPAFLALGVGVGLTTGVIDGLAIATVPAEQAGTATGLFNTARIATETVALAGVGALLAALSGGDLAGRSFTTALHTVGWTLAVVAVVMSVVTAVLLRRPTR